MALTTVKQAASSSTPSGIAAHRFSGTHTYSACGPVGDHPVADREAGDALAHLDDDARVAVAERNGLVELGLDGPHRRTDAVGPQLVDDLPHLVGLLAGLVEEVGPAELEQHALRTRGHQRPAGPDQQVAGAHQWYGHLLDDGVALLEVLEDLVHGVAGRACYGTKGKA